MGVCYLGRAWLRLRLGLASPSADAEAGATAGGTRVPSWDGNQFAPALLVSEPVVAQFGVRVGCMSWRPI